MEATPAAGIAATSASTSAAPTRRYYALPSHSLRLPAVTNASAAQQGTHRAPASTATELLTTPSSDESGAATSAVKPTPRCYVLPFRVTKPAATAQQQAEAQEPQRARDDRMAQELQRAEQCAESEKRAEAEQERRRAEQLAEAEQEQARQRACDEQKAEQERQSMCGAGRGAESTGRTEGGAETAEGL